jgi:selenide,water dikinase
VKEITKEEAILDNGTTLPQDITIWATGAAAHECTRGFADGGLATTPEGWVAVNSHMQSTSCAHIFAAGDCCHIATTETSPPKAGVYAVRTGPILIHNLLAQLRGEELIEYTPQDDFLRLYNCADGTAIGLRFGIAFQGRWVWHVKDTIDQNFMDLFKEENLPEQREGREEKTEQFDAKANAAYSVTETPEEAAELLASREADTKPWDVIKRMGADAGFREQVVQITLQKFDNK